MNNIIEWIFFDVGGVLADESEILKIWDEYAFETIKYFQPKTTIEDILLLKKEASGMVGDLGENLITLVLNNKGEIIKAIELFKTKKHFGPKYYDLLKIRPEVIKVIQQLAKKYKIGILANQNIKAREVLQKAGILSYFEDMNMSDDFKLSKPDPNFYKKIFEITGANPKKSILIDDNIERGLISAKILGMTTIWYKLEKREYLPDGIVDKTIESLNELLVLLK